MREKYRGYWIEKMGNSWDAYMPAYNDDPDSRVALWLSPYHPTKAAAKRAISAEIRGVNRALREALHRYAKQGR